MNEIYWFFISLVLIFVIVAIYKYRTKYRQSRCPYNRKIKCSVQNLPCRHCYYYKYEEFK